MVGDFLPKLGLGTLYNTDPKTCSETVTKALDIGYHHIDTAQMYENEEHVGGGIARASTPRDELFLATKIHQNNLSYEDVLSTTDDSLDRLGVNTIDLLYVHWPVRAYEPEETFAAFDELVNAGKIKHVGVSNFTPALIDEAREWSDAPIVANQVEVHPLLQQEKLLSYCRTHNITLVAYSPLAKGEVFNIPEITAIADKHGVSEAQVSLAWLFGKDGIVAIPKAMGDHVQENYDALTVELDDEDIKYIESIDREKRFADPEFAPWNV